MTTEITTPEATIYDAPDHLDIHNKDYWVLGYNAAINDMLPNRKESFNLLDRYTKSYNEQLNNLSERNYELRMKNAELFKEVQTLLAEQEKKNLQ